MHHYWVTLLYSCNGPLGLQTGCMFKCDQFNIEHVYFFIFCLSLNLSLFLLPLCKPHSGKGGANFFATRCGTEHVKQGFQALAQASSAVAGGAERPHFYSTKELHMWSVSTAASSISAFLLPVRGISARRTQKSAYTQRMPQRTNNRHTFFHLIRKWTRERRKRTTQAVLPSASSFFQVVYSQIMPSTCQDCCFDSACSMFHACSYNYKSSEDDRSLDDARNCGSVNVTIVEWNTYSL